MKSVCIVTSGRADYGILKPLIHAINDDADLDLRLVVTGMHLCPEYGNTVTEIVRDGFPVYKKIDIQLSSDFPKTMSKTMGLALICFADFFEEYSPDLVVLLGDRYEIAAVACAASNQRVPIAHIHGGELTEGAVDNSFRHAITKMSHLHFTSCDSYRQRVIQMGEHPDTVFNVGAMGVENVNALPRLPLEEIGRRIGHPLSEQSYVLVTFHPVTLDDGSAARQLNEIMLAMEGFPELFFIVTKANTDAGGRTINELWAQYCLRNANCILVDSLGVPLYISSLRHASFMLGNSSSGILEGPALKIPIVNIGDRQQGRIQAANIINCQPVAEEVARAIRTALSPEFKQLAANVDNPYGDGFTSGKILKIIKERLAQGINVKKKFYDLELPLN